MTQREYDKALADMEYGMMVMRENLLKEGEIEKADRLLTAFNTVEYIITDWFKQEEGNK